MKYTKRTLKLIQNFINNLSPFDERHSDVVYASAWFKTEHWQMIRIVLRSTTIDNVIQDDQFFTHMEIFTTDGDRIHEWGHYDMTFNEAYDDLKKRSSSYFSKTNGFEYNYKSDYHKIGAEAPTLK